MSYAGVRKRARDKTVYGSKTRRIWERDWHVMPQRKFTGGLSVVYCVQHGHRDASAMTIYGDVSCNMYPRWFVLSE